MMKKNKEEFLEVLEANRGIIFKVCNMYCKDTEDQKDLVQDVIIQLWNSFDRYNEEYKISTWIYRIALNVAISTLRKSTSRKKVQAPFEHDFVEIAADQDENKDENLKLLRHFIDQLDEMNKALMILYLDGNSHEEIANILNISTSNVGTKINRIKQKLKIQFQNN